MIEHLVAGRAAYFHSRRRNLSHDAIERLFRTVRAQVRAASQNLFKLNRVAVEDCLCSAVCFSYERPVGFLDAEADEHERVFGFLMVIEKSDCIAIIKSGLDLPPSFKAAHLGKLLTERLERAIARENAVFEQLRLRNMSTSKLALRSKSFEASDLENSVPLASANRFVAQGYRVRLPEGSYSATPTTGRISARGNPTGYTGLVAWAGAVIDLLDEEDAATASFIRNFARPLDLDTIPPAVRPTFLAIDVPSLAETLLEADAPLRLVADGEAGRAELTRAEIDAVLVALDESFPIRRTAGNLSVRAATGAAEIGRLRIGKTRISLRQLHLPIIADLRVEERTQPLGEDPNALSLARHIDRHDLFTILFSDIALAYIEGSLFRDQTLVGGGEEFLRHLIALPELADATSEKGTYAAGQTQFSEGSVFRIVAEHTAAECDILICDDLGDEWADFIGLSTSPGAIAFYHAKHGARSLGASPFHEAVGQAMKNLGRMGLAAETLPPKFASWAEPYRNGGVETAVSRLMRGGTAEEIEAHIANIRMAPDLSKRVYIVTSSLSRGDVAAAFANAAGGTAPSPHFVQLYWLLTNYFAACTEMGATGYVMCQP